MGLLVVWLVCAVVGGLCGVFVYVFLLRLGVFVSRGHGLVQRKILAELAALPAGHLLLVGDGGWSYRRAAHCLASEGLVSLERVSRYGRQRLAVRRVSALDRLAQARANRQ